ncbi:MAG TPA: 50S ribosomal protein L23 [Patescibacteria group bacterium]|nr:50S ribosomal protein L23 [Patescibacteria group bacterium]
MASKQKKNFQIAYRVLLEPWITEEATRIAELNKYIFKVAKNSDKNQIKKAVEEVYGVKVISINTVNIPAKKRVRGATVGKKSGFKKAIVTVKEGEKIELFEGK